MKFSVDDVEYDVDLDHLTYEEAEFVYDNTGMGVFEFGEGLRRAVPKAIRALIVLGRRRSGVASRWQDIPADLDITTAAASLLEGMFRPFLDELDRKAAEGIEGQGVEPDPTTPAPTPESAPGTDPESGSPATS